MLRAMSRRQRAEPTLDEAEPSSRRGRRPNPIVDAAIRTATLDLISEVGYDHVTFEAVATRAGVSRNAIYRRWLAGCSGLRRGERRRRRNTATSPNTGTLAGDLCALLARIVRRFENPQWASTAGDVIAVAQNNLRVRDLAALECEGLGALMGQDRGHDP